MGFIIVMGCERAGIITDRRAAQRICCLLAPQAPYFSLYRGNINETASTQKETIFITDWGSVTFYSKAVQAALYSINGHPPPIAEDRLTEVMHVQYE